MLVFFLAHISVTCTVTQWVVSLNIVPSVLKTQQIVTPPPLQQIQLHSHIRHHQLSPALLRLLLSLLPQALKRPIPWAETHIHLLRILLRWANISGQQMREV